MYYFGVRIMGTPGFCDIHVRNNDELAIKIMRIPPAAMAAMPPDAVTDYVKTGLRVVPLRWYRWQLTVTRIADDPPVRVSLLDVVKLPFTRVRLQESWGLASRFRHLDIITRQNRILDPSLIREHPRFAGLRRRYEFVFDTVATLGEFDEEEEA